MVDLAMIELDRKLTISLSRKKSGGGNQRQNSEDK